MYLYRSKPLTPSRRKMSARCRCFATHHCPPRRTPSLLLVGGGGAFVSRTGNASCLAAVVARQTQTPTRGCAAAFPCSRRHLVEQYLSGCEDPFSRVVFVPPVGSLIVGHTAEGVRDSVCHQKACVMGHVGSCGGRSSSPTPRAALLSTTFSQASDVSSLHLVLSSPETKR